MAARMETSGEAGRIHIAAETAMLLGSEFQLEPKGPVQIKGKRGCGNIVPGVGECRSKDALVNDAAMPAFI